MRPVYSMFPEQMSMRVVEGIHCTSIAEDQRLVASPDIVCYGSDHIFTALVMWMLLFGFVLGFPMWGLYITHRSAMHRGGQDFLDPKRAQKYGFLYRGCKIELLVRVFAFNVLSPLINFPLCYM
jgi:hypothetical protein